MKENELIERMKTEIALERKVALAFDEPGSTRLEDLLNDVLAHLQTPAAVPAEYLSAVRNFTSVACSLVGVGDVRFDAAYSKLDEFHPFTGIRKNCATPAVSNADDGEQPEISSRTLVTALVSYMKENGVRECGNEDFHGILLSGGPINDPRVLLAAKVAELEEKLVVIQTDDADRLDAKRWRTFLGDNLTTSRETLVDARTGEPTGQFRWTIYWYGPNATILQDSVDAAMEAAK